MSSQQGRFLCQRSQQLHYEGKMTSTSQSITLTLSEPCLIGSLYPATNDATQSFPLSSRHALEGYKIRKQTDVDKTYPFRKTSEAAIFYLTI